MTNPPWSRALPVIGATLIATVVLGGCSGSAEPTGTSSSSAVVADPTQTAEAVDAPAPAAGDRVEGLYKIPDYPISFLALDGFSFSSSEGDGTWAITVQGTSIGIALQDIRSIATVAAAELPDDIAGFIASERSDVIVSDVAAVEVSGVAGQTFTLTQAEGTTPADLWCVTGGSCFKLLPDKPMKVFAARHDGGLLWVGVEYSPQDADQAAQTFDQLVGSIEFG